MNKSKVKQSVSGGFSLIELLVVIFIIGLMIGTVSLSVNIGQEPEELIDEQAQRLLEFSRLAEDRSVMTGEPIGLVLLPPRFSEEGEPTWQYQWLRYRGGQWVDAEEPLNASDLPANLEISLRVEGEEVDFGRMEIDEDTPPVPSVVFYPGGEVTPFRLTIFDAQTIDQQRILSSERIGAVETFDSEEALMQARNETLAGASR